MVGECYVITIPVKRYCVRF